MTIIRGGWNFKGGTIHRGNVQSRRAISAFSFSRLSLFARFSYRNLCCKLHCDEVVLAARATTQETDKAASEEGAEGYIANRRLSTSPAGVYLSA